jgi:hypothetical protein
MQSWVTAVEVVLITALSVLNLQSLLRPHQNPVEQGAREIAPQEQRTMRVMNATDDSER